MPSIRGRLPAGETVLFRSRQHWVVPARDSLLPAGLILAGIVLWVITPGGDGVLGILGTLLGLLRLALLVAGAGWIAYNLVAWKAAVFLVTNRRVIRSEGLVRRRRSETMLATIDDVKVDVGFIGARLGYGRVRVFTQRGNVAAGVLGAITQPAEFRGAIMEARIGESMAARQAMAAAVPAWTAGAASVAAPGPGQARGAGQALRDGQAPGSGSAAGSSAGIAAGSSVRSAGSAAGSSAARAEDAVARLVRLAELRDRGIITPADFEAKKAELLARM
jgi:hypothetical protein